MLLTIKLYVLKDYTPYLEHTSFSVYKLMFQNVSLFSISVIGCPTIRAPPGGTLRREGDRVTIRCNHTEEIWYLTCRNNRWIGEQGNCSLGRTSDFTATEGSLSLPWSNTPR